MYIDVYLCIAVLVNDTDWALLGGDDYQLCANDHVTFISTLHGGWILFVFCYLQIRVIFIICNLYLLPPLYFVHNPIFMCVHNVCWNKCLSQCVLCAALSHFVIFACFSFVSNAIYIIFYNIWSWVKLLDNFLIKYLQQQQQRKMSTTIAPNAARTIAQQFVTFLNKSVTPFHGMCFATIVSCSFHTIIY
jgi:hypothetical protein